MPVPNAPVIANTEVAAQAVSNIGRNTDLSLWGFFLHADALGKLIITGLIVGSLVVWAIILQKYFAVKKLNRLANKFEDGFWSGESLDKLYDRHHAKPADPLTSVFCVGMKEWRRGSKTRQKVGGSDIRAGLLNRIDRVMHVAINRELAAAEIYMTFLASAGSVAPFIGLLGTVWGIMNSFIAIAGSNNSSLSVVAPGIAEALYTTALSLITAIPAVLAYNKFAADLGRYAERLESFASEFSSILARYMDESSAEQQPPQQQYAA